MRHAILILALVACAAAITSRPSSAQTLLTYDGAAGFVDEIAGPPAGCGYPAGPFVGGFPTLAPFVCATAGPAVPPAGPPDARFPGLIRPGKRPDLVDYRFPLETQADGPG